MVFSTILAISTPILICFGCSKAHFVGGGYRNLYPYPHLPYPQPMWVQNPQQSLLLIKVQIHYLHLSYLYVLLYLVCAIVYVCM